MQQDPFKNLVTLDVTRPVWDNFFVVAPLVLIGTREPDGSYDMAPKHMATPMSWQNYFGFVCTPRHATYVNIAREQTFTVSYPRPNQLLQANLAAAPRVGACKPSLLALDTFPAAEVDGVLVERCYLYFECALERLVDGFGDNSLIVGRILAAHVAANALRGPDRDDGELLQNSPLLAYLQPGRHAPISAAGEFPFPPNMKQ